MGGRPHQRVLTQAEKDAKAYEQAVKDQKTSEENFLNASLLKGISSTDQKKQQTEQRKLAQQAYDVIQAKHAKAGTLEYGKGNKALFEKTAGSVNEALEADLEEFKKTWGEDIFKAISTGAAMPTLKEVKDVKKGRGIFANAQQMYDPYTGAVVQQSNPFQYSGNNQQTNNQSQNTGPHKFNIYTGQLL